MQFFNIVEFEFLPTLSLLSEFLSLYRKQKKLIYRIHFSKKFMYYVFGLKFTQLPRNGHLWLTCHNRSHPRNHGPSVSVLHRPFARYHSVSGDGLWEAGIQSENRADDWPSTCCLYRSHSRMGHTVDQTDVLWSGEYILSKMVVSKLNITCNL